VLSGSSCSGSTGSGALRWLAEAGIVIGPTGARGLGCGEGEAIAGIWIDRSPSNLYVIACICQARPSHRPRDALPPPTLLLPLLLLLLLLLLRWMGSKD
jgi:hypothetical protein